jgi:hypothetical protein
MGGGGGGRQLIRLILARGPVHLSPPKEVDVNVINRLTCKNYNISTLRK